MSPYTLNDPICVAPVNAIFGTPPVPPVWLALSSLLSNCPMISLVSLVSPPTGTGPAGEAFARKLIGTAPRSIVCWIRLTPEPMHDSAAVAAASPVRPNPAIRFSKPVTVNAAIPITDMITITSMTVSRAMPFVFRAVFIVAVKMFAAMSLEPQISDFDGPRQRPAPKLTKRRRVVIPSHELPVHRVMVLNGDRNGDAGPSTSFSKAFVVLSLTGDDRHPHQPNAGRNERRESPRRIRQEICLIEGAVDGALIIDDVVFNPAVDADIAAVAGIGQLQIFDAVRDRGHRAVHVSQEAGSAAGAFRKITYAILHALQQKDRC